MKHLEIEQLKKYAEQRLSGDEMTGVVLHLDECADCFDLFEKMFPALSDQSQTISLAGLTADGEGNFHLDYDEHLRPFVDFEADEATREIVESHLSNCTFCARAVKELREFSDGLRLRQVQKDEFAAPEIFGSSDYYLTRFSTSNFWRLSLPLVGVLILGIGSWLLWQSGTPDSVAENQASNNEPKTANGENSFNRQPENINADQEIAKTESPRAPREDDSANAKPNRIENKTSDPNRTDEDARLIAALPPDFRVQFQNAVRTQKVNLPAFVGELREDGNLRGAASLEKNVIVAPNAQAVRNSQPTFSWRNFAAAGESYVVTIYDSEFNRVAVSPNLRNAKWQPDVPLARGKIYQWQVAAENSSEFYAARFKVLDANALARLNAVEKAAPRSPLARGIGYAAEGLLNEAAREFEKEIRNNPRGILARKLRNSMVGFSKRRP